MMTATMKNRVSRNVSLTGGLRTFIQPIVNSGRCGDAGEVVRAVLRPPAAQAQRRGPIVADAAENGRDAR